MTAPEFDSDGYPTDATLDVIKHWLYSDLVGLMKFVEQAWSYPDRVQHESAKWSLSTGGWSGNESIICALQSNIMFWLLCWVSSRRGGYYEFEVKEKQ